MDRFIIQRISFVFLFAVFAFCPDLHSQSTGNFIKVYPSTMGSSPSSKVNGVTSDSHGNIYLAARVSDQVTMDTLPPTNPQNIWMTAFIARLDTAGRANWVISNNTSYPSTQYSWSEATSIKISPQGWLYVWGYFRDSMVLGNLPVQGPSSGYQNFYVTADTSMGFITLMRYWYEQNIHINLSFDNQGNRFYYGSYHGTQVFWGAALPARCGSSAPFIAKVNAQDSLLWIRYPDICGNLSIGRINDVKIASDGSLYFNGFLQYADSMKFGGTWVYGQGGSDVWWGKLDSTGQIVFMKTEGGTGNQIGTGILLNQNGDVTLSGTAEGNTDFGSLFGVDVLSYLSGFVARYTNTGTHKWAEFIKCSTSDVEFEGSVVEDSEQKMYASFDFQRQISAFRQYMMNTDPNSGGTRDIGFIKFDSIGTVLALDKLTGTGNEYVTDMCLKPNGELVLCGETHSTQLQLAGLAPVSANNVYQGAALVFSVNACGNQTLAIQHSIQGLTCNFSAQAPVNDYGLIQWNFGDGLIDTGLSVSHTYAQPGAYLVCMEGWGICGHSDTCQTIYVGVQSLEPLSEGAEISIYPDPAQQFIQIRFGTAAHLPLNYAIQDEAGKTVLSGTIQTASEGISVDKLSPGMYLISLNAKSTAYHSRFMKL